MSRFYVSFACSTAAFAASVLYFLRSFFHKKAITTTAITAAQISTKGTA